MRVVKKDWPLLKRGSKRLMDSTNPFSPQLKSVTNQFSKLTKKSSKLIKKRENSKLN